MYRTLDRAARGIAIVLAWAGGLALLAVVVVSCLSILGRAGQTLGLPLTSIRGDTEWVEFGTGFAVFAFLPWCTLTRGHAAVDLFMPLFGRANRGLDVVSDLLLLGVAALIGWRMWLGMMDKMANHETTFILRAEIWLGYAAAMVGAAGFVLIAAFCVVRSLRLATGRSA